MTRLKKEVGSTLGIKAFSVYSERYQTTTLTDESLPPLSSTAHPVEPSHPLA